MEAATVRPGARRAEPIDESFHGMAPLSVKLPARRSATRAWIGIAAVGLALLVSIGIRLSPHGTPPRPLPAAFAPVAAATISFDAPVTPREATITVDGGPLVSKLKAAPSPTPVKASSPKQKPNPPKKKASNVIDDRDPYGK
jgi:hypothetical protein